MSNYTCYLITVLYMEGVLECAIKIDNNLLTDVIRDYPMSDKHFFHNLLPEHVKSCGPVLKIEEIFEISIVDNIEKEI